MITASISSARRSRRQRLNHLSSRQFGAFTWEQMRASGYPESTISDHLRDGWLHRIHPRTYSWQQEALSIDTLRSAALLATGPESAIVKRSALALYDCSRFALTGRIQVGVARRVHSVLFGVDVHYSNAYEHGHVIELCGHRVTSFAWTLSELGTELEPHQIAHVIHQGRLRRRFELEELDAVLALRGSFRGCRNVRAALAMYRAGSAGTRSHDEDTVYAWVRQLVRKMPLPNTHVRAGDQSFEIDLPFRSRKLCIEIDGPLHDDPEQRERDRVRDVALRAAGYRVERFHWRDIRDRPAWCKARLRTMLGAAS